MFMAILIGLHFYILIGKGQIISKVIPWGNKIKEMYYSLLCLKYEFEHIKIVL